MKAIKVGNFHLDSPDRSISSPAVEVRPSENVLLQTAAKQNACAVFKLGHIWFWNITDSVKPLKFFK